MSRSPLSLLLPAFLLACGEEKESPDTEPLTADADADGYASDEDCDDANAGINPGAAEVCDEADNDCDGQADEGVAITYYLDADSDGYGGDDGTTAACAAPEGYAEQAGDCNDTDTDYHPGAAEDDCADPADYNCDGSTGYADADSDGAAACEDCDDGDAAVNPDAGEICDGQDNDCDESVDAEDDDVEGAGVWYADEDGDAYGDPGSPVVACEQPAGAVEDKTDCDDEDGSAHPGAEEICGGDDEDCDGLDDEDGAVGAAAVYRDSDGDGYGDASSSRDACGVPGGYVADDTDCDDSDAGNNPGEAEICDGDDDDCDGDADEDSAIDARTWYLDGDSDGYGTPDTSDVECAKPAGYVATNLDCDDSDPSIKPGASETPYDGIDQDCAAGDLTDVDGDGYDAPEVSGDDCDDENPDANPGEKEVCDDADNDCDAEIDEDSAIDAQTWYLDSDLDGHGAPDVSEIDCDQPAGYSSSDLDCDDADPAFDPDAEDTPYDGIDQDCSGADLTDVDGDGYDGLEAGGDDCDDADAGANPGEKEACNNTDDDCDDEIDEDDVCSLGYGGHRIDKDGDYYYVLYNDRGFGIMGTKDWYGSADASGTPEGLTWNEDQTVLYYNDLSGNVFSQTEPFDSTSTLVGKFSVGQAGGGVYLDGYYYVGDYYTADIYQMDVTTGKTATYSYMGGLSSSCKPYFGNNAMSIDADGTVYVASPCGIVTYAPGGTTATLLSAYTGLISAVAMDADNELYSLDSSGNIVHFDKVSGAVLGSVKIAYTPSVTWTLAVDGNGDFVVNYWGEQRIFSGVDGSLVYEFAASTYYPGTSTYYWYVTF